MEANTKTSDEAATNMKQKTTTTKSTNVKKKKSFQEQYQSMMERIETLESLIQKSTIQKRRRAAFLLDTRPSYRSTHLRSFTFHYCSHNHFEYTNKHTNPHQKVMKGTKWTLVIEGKLLVPNIQNMDSTKKRSHEIPFNKSARDNFKSNLPGPVGRVASDTLPYSSTNTTKAYTISNPPPLPQTSTFTPASASTSASTSASASISTSTSTSTSINQEDQQILFTHLFDKIVVSFQKVQYESNTNESSNHADGSTPSIKIKKRKSISTAPQPILQPPKILTWTRQRATIDDTTFYPTQDSHTFHAIYFEPNDDDIMQPTTTTTTTATATISHTHSTIDKSSSNINEKLTQQKTFSKQKNNDTSDNETKIIAKISLYRRYSSMVEARYKPSSDFIRMLLPNFIPKNPFLEESNHYKNTHQNQSSKSNMDEKKHVRKKAKITISMNKKKHIKKTFHTSSQQNSSSTKSNKSNNNNTTIPTHNSFHIPQTLTMKEAVSAIFIYIKDHNLQDRSDLSIINNDDVLTELFGCERIMFSEIQDTLIKRELITLVTQDNMEPIRLTYIMTNETAVPNPYWKKSNDKMIKNEKMDLNSVANTNDKSTQITSTSSSQPSTSLHTTKDDNTPNPTPQDTKSLTTRKRGGMKQSEKQTSTINNHEPNPLIFNINVDIPSPFHNKIMELLRKVKQRESEYTNSRTKAIKILQKSIASTNYGHNNTMYNSNTNDNHNIEKEEEAFIRSKIEEIVSGQGEHTGARKGYMSAKQSHVPVLLALAKTAPIGSEARNSALIDARMSILLDRLDYHTRVAQMYRDVVKACQNK